MKRVFGQIFGVVLLAGLFSHAALAQTADPTAAANAYVNAPHNWQMWFPEAGSPMQEKIDWLMKYVLWIMAGIVAFVGGLMVYVMLRFNARANKTPALFTHNTLVEVIWIVIPTLLLAVIIVPSISLIYYEADDSNPYMTIDAVGHQWYWEYKYESTPGLDYTSYMIPDDKLQPGDIRRLTVDHPIVVPVGKKIKFNISSTDVLHGFYLPSLGVQRYAIPGTVVTSWTIIPKVGTYYGECNQICGVNHDAMPIEIKAVSMDDYLAWVKVAQANYVMNSFAPNLLSSPMPVNQFADLAVVK
ncbi:MAG: cytochrome c oxidase subunit II [Acidocella sp. 20-57-95]|nr:MAG: cytochrome c oxidase subunit II [Acidocella sp. 20-57-95]OYV57067.1 MAG: cytochrome c oxidase subunit II [Acidocella sp. 21-58-7]HQT64085.1 cytochrome c oxidase subunit II [Acidocella sp.]